VRVVSLVTGMVSTLVGSREPGFRDGLGGLARLGSPLGMALLPAAAAAAEGAR
jgi:hypothetical protein